MNLQVIKRHRTTHAHCTNTNFFVLILYYSYLRCSQWGKLGEGHIVSVFIIFPISCPFIISK